MLNKKLYASLMISNDEAFLSEDVREMYLEYYFIEEEVVEEGESYRGMTYGLEIVKREIRKNNTVHIENVEIKDISCSSAYVKHLIEKLANQTVTPVTVKEILSDIIGVEDMVPVHQSVDVA